METDRIYTQTRTWLHTVKSNNSRSQLETNDQPAGSGESLLAVRTVFLDHVQNVQIHAMRANLHSMFSVGIYSDGPKGVPVEVDHGGSACRHPRARAPV